MFNRSNNVALAYNMRLQATNILQSIKKLKKQYIVLD